MLRRNTKKEMNGFRHIPNILTISRIIITLFVIYLIFRRAKIEIIVPIFAVGALTDFFDGLLARKYKWKSEFGRKADMLADRFLWVGTALAFFVSYGLGGELDWNHYLQLMFIMTREIISAPFAIAAFFTGKQIPKVRIIAKVVTFIQGFALPSLMLSIYYPIFLYLSWPLSIVLAVIGFKSAIFYLKDIGVSIK